MMFEQRKRMALAVDLVAERIRALGSPHRLYRNFQVSAISEEEADRAHRRDRSW